MSTRPSAIRYVYDGGAQGSIDGREQPLKVAIVGDIAHSRVARSNIHGLVKMGADVHLAGPATMMPARVEELSRLFTRVWRAPSKADVIMMLRI